MCGIIAAVSKHGGLCEDTLARATRRLRHRGPDAQRIWMAPDGKAGLGHARLSIIDLETGDQPIANEDERLHLVANGELYDFERIRQGLERDGHVFRTRSDSEIALHLLPGRCRAWRGWIDRPRITRTTRPTSSHGLHGYHGSRLTRPSRLRYP